MKKRFPRRINRVKWDFMQRSKLILTTSSSLRTCNEFSSKGNSRVTWAMILFPSACSVSYLAEKNEERNSLQVSNYDGERKSHRVISSFSMKTQRVIKVPSASFVEHHLRLTMINWSDNKQFRQSLMGENWTWKWKCLSASCLMF